MLSIAGDIAGASGAMAGLILVFLGGVLANFDSYEKTERGSVIAKFRWRAWPTLVAFLLALSASLGAIIAKWLCLVWLAQLSLVGLFLSFAAIAVMAIHEVKGIKP